MSSKVIHPKCFKCLVRRDACSCERFRRQCEEEKSGCNKVIMAHFKMYNSEANVQQEKCNSDTTFQCNSEAWDLWLSRGSIHDHKSCKAGWSHFERKISPRLVLLCHGLRILDLPKHQWLGYTQQCHTKSRGLERDWCANYSRTHSAPGVTSQIIGQFHLLICIIPWVPFTSEQANAHQLPGCASYIKSFFKLNWKCITCGKSITNDKAQLLCYHAHLPGRFTATCKSL